MVFWQLTIDCNDPRRLTEFWEQVLGWSRTPPTAPDTTWWRHYQGRADADGTFDDRLFDPEGLRPPLWFQEVPEGKAGKNRLHLDVYVSGRDDTLDGDARIALVQDKVTELLALGATEIRREQGDTWCFVTLQDPEGNEFCVA